MLYRIVKLSFLALLAAIFVAAAFAAVPSVSAARPSAPPDPQHGAYVFATDGGCGCHMGQAGFLAGGQQFQGPFGTVYSKNLTPDKDTGLGSWTDQQIIDAIRTGKDDGGKQLSPVMPYVAFSGMSDQDVADLVAFLRTVPAIKNQVPEDQLKAPPAPFTPPVKSPAVAPASGVERGNYLVNHVSLCGDCHTPPKADGSPDLSKFLAGGFSPAAQAFVPNITPDKNTGIGNWTTDQIVTLLKTGTRPDGTHVGGLMAEVVDGGLKNLTDTDAQAIAQYLKSITPVDNLVKAPSLPTTGTGARNPLPLIGLSALAGMLVLAGWSLRRLNSRA